MRDVRERDLEQIPDVAVGQLVVDVPPLPPRSHELGIAKDGELVRHCRLLAPEPLRNLVNAELLVREQADEHQPAWIPESFEGPRETLGLALRQGYDFGLSHDMNI